MALNGLSDEQIREASWVVHDVAGASSYLHGVGYSNDKFQQELDQAMQHLQGAAPAKTRRAAMPTKNDGGSRNPARKVHAASRQ